MEDSESKIKAREAKLAEAQKEAAPVIPNSPLVFVEVEKRLKERMEEQKRIEDHRFEQWFNYWKALYDEWLAVPLWNIEEATCLLCGLKPDLNYLHYSGYREHTRYACWYDGYNRYSEDSILCERFKKKKLLIDRSIQAGELIPHSNHPYVFWKHDILKWAIAKIGSDKLPTLLVDWYEQQPEQPTEQVASNQPPEVKPIDDLTESERSKLLKMVLGMALVAYGYNPSAQRNEATGQAKGSICLDLDTRGLHVDVKEIRRFINEAAERFLEQPNEP